MPTTDEESSHFRLQLLGDEERLGGREGEEDEEERRFTLLELRAEGVSLGKREGGREGGRKEGRERERE